jgi:hypothetical protein
MSTDETRRLRLLLDSMSADAPRAGAKRATLAALGLGTAAAATAGAAGAVGSIGGLAKLAAIGALCGFATGGALIGARYALAPDLPQQRPRVVVGAPASGRAVEKAGADRSKAGEVSSTTSEDGATAARPDAAAIAPELEPPEWARNAQRQTLEDGTAKNNAPAVATFDATPSLASSLREETMLLDRARALIFAGDPGAGLLALDGYATAFPRGALAPEAALLRIKALVMTGDRARARALARSFMAERPRDPHIEELRSLVEP